MNVKVLGSDGVHRIDEAARTILERTGVLVPHEPMLRLFEKADAKVDFASQRVRIPSSLIDLCLSTAGKTFTLYGRDRAKTAPFGQGRRNYNSSAGQALWVESDGTRRFPTMADVTRAAQIGHMLPLLNVVGPMADPHELDVRYRCVEVTAELIRKTDKPLTFWFHDRASARFIIELMAAVAGSRENLARYPLAYPFLEPISPLRFPFNGIDLLFETCQIPLPVPIGPMAQVGLSAPGTLAATVSVETAEILAGVCVVQLIRPGTPVCFGGIPHAFDMCTTQCIFGGPEQGLMAAALTEVGKRYGLPVYINVGLVDAKCVDAQAGLEAAASLLLGVQAGADIFGHMGIVGADQGGGLEMLVFQHEVMSYIERLARGFEVTSEKLALDLIDDIGPGGTFIDQEHTVRHFREEVWMPRLLNRQYWQQWEDEGKPDLAVRVRRHVQDLLAAYEQPPLADGLAANLDRIVADAKKHLTK